MAPIVNVNNAANWLKVYETTLTAVSTFPRGHNPIPAFSIPVQFDSHCLIIEASSSLAKPTWNLAFRVSQRFGVEGVRLVEGDSQAIRLGSTLVRFPVFSDTYTLKIRFPRWHREMDLTVWKYTGIMLDTNDLLGDSQIQLARIESKVDAIVVSGNP